MTSAKSLVVRLSEVTPGNTTSAPSYRNLNVLRLLARPPWVRSRSNLHREATDNKTA